MLHTVDEKLYMEPKGFADSDMDVLETFVHRMGKITYKNFTLGEVLNWEEIKKSQDRYLGSICGRIFKIRYFRLKKLLLEGENPEINTDKEILVSRLGTLGFRREIADALAQLDKKLYQAGTPLDFKGCMDLIRTIYEEIIEDAAKNAAIKIGKPPPDYPKRAFNPWNNYLKSENILTNEEHELTQKLYNYLSNAGAHRLGSAPEQVRITKNMVIELGLMVLGRIQNLATQASAKQVTSSVTG